MNLMIRLIQLRRERKFSQKALAKIIGVSRSALAQWETGLSRPSFKNLQKLATTLSVSMDWLISGDPIENDYHQISTQTYPHIPLSFKKHLPTIHTHPTFINTHHQNKRAILNMLRNMM